tara:strand:+ start:590 stop:787 length:198 start_codon:yes stop_codon:yes gene_type:complete
LGIVISGMYDSDGDGWSETQLYIRGQRTKGGLQKGIWVSEKIKLQIGIIFGVSLTAIINAVLIWL